MVKDKVSLDSSTESADIENKPVVGSGGIFAETTTKSSDDNESFFPKLSYKERLIGFAMCFGIGETGRGSESLAECCPVIDRDLTVSALDAVDEEITREDRGVVERR